VLGDIRHGQEESEGAKGVRRGLAENLPDQEQEEKKGRMRTAFGVPEDARG